MTPQLLSKVAPPSHGDWRLDRTRRWHILREYASERDRQDRQSPLASEVHLVEEVADHTNFVY